MPLGFAKSIFSHKAPAAGGASNAGYWQSEYFHSDSQQAAHPLVDAGSGNDWISIGGDRFSMMFWIKGTTSSLDTSYNNQVLFRTLSANNGDNGIFAEVTGSGFVLGTQQNNGTFKLIIWQPTSFSANYLDDNWHHFLFELNSSSSLVYADGVNKSSEATLPSGYAQPNGTTQYAFVSASTTSANSNAYSGFRSGKLQIADFWFKGGNVGNLASNISSIYSSGWQDLGSDGTAGSTLPSPDIFTFITSDALDSSLRSGASQSILKGSVNANLIQSSSGGPS